MKNENIKKLKKYLFYISIFFFMLSFVHLSYSYIVENSSSEPVSWWSISEWIVGAFPSLNPLKPLEWNNEYIVNLLYRSLLKYDIQQKKIVGDIAKCDISSLINIECVINEDAVWSNGNPIEAKDIVSTYNLIKETESNPSIISLLEGVDIEQNDNVIVFRNTKKDINFLNIFFQPILSQETINQLNSANIKWSFPYSNGIYSGEYILKDVRTDDNIGVSKIILEKNKNYGDSNISKITIFVFPDANTLERNKQAITVFNDTSNILGTSVSRLNDNQYTLSQFVSLFINSDKITEKSLRSTILSSINRDNLITLLWEDHAKPVFNPYLSDKNIDVNEETSIDAIMAKLGYKKKSQLIEDLKNQSSTTTSDESTEPTWETNNEQETISELPERSEVTIDRYQKDSEFIVEPEYVDIHNFITKDNVRLEGIGTKDIVDEVYINDYKLQWFSSGDERFYYRLSEELWTIKEGLNTYKIYFVAKGEKLLKEEINFLYYKNKDTLDWEKIKYVDNLYNKEKQQIQNKKEEQTQVNNSDDEETTIQEPQVNKDELEKLENLDGKLYYSSDLKPFTLNLLYLNTRQDFEKTAQLVEKSLKEIGITTKLDPTNPQEYGSKLLTQDYDLIIGWIDTGYFTFNLFPYFHSSQYKSGFNYANIRKTSLDIILEELRENIYSKEQTTKLENKALDIFKQEQVFKTLYSPKYNLLIDKSIKLQTSFSSLPKGSLVSEVIEKSYLRQNKSFSLKGKSFGGFTKYLWRKLYE